MPEEVWKEAERLCDDWVQDAAEIKILEPRGCLYQKKKKNYVPGQNTGVSGRLVLGKVCAYESQLVHRQEWAGGKV